MDALLDRLRREQGELRRSRSVRASLRLSDRWRPRDEQPEGTYRARTPAMTRHKLEQPARAQKPDRKFSDLFYKKQKSVSAKELFVPERIPPKAAAILHIGSPERRVRRGSEGEAGCVNRAFVHSTPPSGLFKLPYGALVEGCAGELPSLSACAPPAAPRHKQRAPDSHHQALFAAVEHGYLDKARNVLESTDVEVNGLSADGLSALDVAVLCGQRALAQLLIEFGGKEGAHFESGSALSAQLRALCREAEARLQAAAGAQEPTDGSGRSASAAGPTGCAGSSERDKQLQHWDRRHQTLKRLLAGWSGLRAGGALAPPPLEVVGPMAVCVRLPIARQAPARDAPLITKYRVEWSTRGDFSSVCGSRVVQASALRGEGRAEGRVLVTGLTRGRRYYFRVSGGNLKGWGEPTLSLPRSVVPSSWRDVSTPVSRGESVRVDEELEALAAECSRAGAGGAGAGAEAARGRKHTIRQLFAATKFHKSLRRGVYLACVLHQQERVLVTSEEFVPVVQVDETYPAALAADLHWLMRVAGAWGDTKSLRADLARHPSPALHFRRRLLAAAAQLQTALGLVDLGQVYPRPLRDASGTLVLSLVGAGKPPALNSRWAALHKLRRRATHDDSSVSDMLLSSLPDQIRYEQASRAPLPRGLYVGYLQLQSSVEAVHVLVPAARPNVPPHTRLRDNPHVSAEEWQYLKSHARGDSEENDERPSEGQDTFVRQVASGARTLLRELALVGDHRLYDLEVIELSTDVSLLMLCPPAERACAAPGRDLLQRADLLSLPLQAFELIHLQTYRPHSFATYCRLSTQLELDVALAAHAHREAFSCDELQAAKERLARLERLQVSLNLAWKAERWLMDLIAFARDKDRNSAGVPLARLLPSSDSADDCPPAHLLQLPRDGRVGSTSCSRGSWPGPAGSGPTLHPEFSKSEQQLATVESGPRADPLPRNGSDDSQLSRGSAYTSGSQLDVESVSSAPAPRLPPSRSEDTLVLHPEGGERAASRPRSVTSASPLSAQGSCGGSALSLSSDSEARPPFTDTGQEEGQAVAEGAGILQVFAAYETGLAAGTSLKLHVTARTTAREVVELVVRQLNMAALLRGRRGPLYPPNRLPDFCLVAVIGARERCLRDDFRPLQLQNPWRRGRLYVRLKHDVLAAITHTAPPAYI